jgi:hypothetical protein
MGDNRRVPPTTSFHDAPHRSADDPDAVCSAAVELAMAAAVEIADPGAVGEHLSVTAEGDRTVTHLFSCLSRGYRGWRWAVTVARAPRARTATVSEVVLLPGPESVLAPAWVPWSDRIAPGDLGATDALPYRADDPYLEPGLEVTDPDDEDAAATWELGLGRVRVLSPVGRDAAATRWYLGDRGPTADEAINSAAACASCGYFVQLAGSLRQVFGVCANEWSPSDGRVVSVDHGCGAHSETDVDRPEAIPLPPPILDETGHVTVVLPPAEPESQPEVEAEVEAEVSAEAEPVGTDVVLVVPDAVVEPELLAVPVSQEPAEQEATVQEPVIQEPAAQEPAAQEPAAQEPAAQEPAAQEPAPDVPPGDPVAES